MTNILYALRDTLLLKILIKPLAPYYDFSTGMYELLKYDKFWVKKTGKTRIIDRYHVIQYLCESEIPFIDYTKIYLAYKNNINVSVYLINRELIPLKLLEKNMIFFYICGGACSLIEHFSIPPPFHVMRRRQCMIGSMIDIYRCNLSFMATHINLILLYTGYDLSLDMIIDYASSNFEHTPIIEENNNLNYSDLDLDLNSDLDSDSDSDSDLELHLNPNNLNYYFDIYDSDCDSDRYSIDSYVYKACEFQEEHESYKYHRNSDYQYE